MGCPRPPRQWAPRHSRPGGRALSGTLPPSARCPADGTVRHRGNRWRPVRDWIRRRSCASQRCRQAGDLCRAHTRSPKGLDSPSASAPRQTTLPVSTVPATARQARRTSGRVTAPVIRILCCCGSPGAPRHRGQTSPVPCTLTPLIKRQPHPDCKYPANDHECHQCPRNHGTLLSVVGIGLMCGPVLQNGP